MPHQRIDAVSSSMQVDGALINMARLSRDGAATAPDACRMQAGEIVRFLLTRPGLERYHSPYAGEVLLIRTGEGRVEAEFNWRDFSCSYTFPELGEEGNGNTPATN